jgi:hypothetical protein
MSNANGLHDSLDSTFAEKVKDILAAKESASGIADRVEELRSFLEEHEVRVYNTQRTNVLGLTEHEDSMAWFYRRYQESIYARPRPAERSAFKIRTRL